MTSKCLNLITRRNGPHSPSWLSSLAFILGVIAGMLANSTTLVNAQTTGLGTISGTVT
jgi:hypothetical protein